MTAPLIIVIIASYLLGAIPTGLWLGLRLRGIDIRKHGSKNIGATNTKRVLGKWLGALALVGDIIKGVVPVLVFAHFVPWIHAPLICGVAAILGHVTSPFAGFRGGKGVATSAGVFLALAPTATLIALAVFVVVFAITRMVSAGSICAAVALTAVVLALPHTWALRGIVALVAMLVLIRHSGNIRRIMQGKENRI